MIAPFRLPTRAPTATEAQWENLGFRVAIGIAVCLVYPGALLAMGDATGAKVVIGTMIAIVLAYALAHRLNNFLLGVNLIVFAAYCGIMIQTARQGGLEAPTLRWLVTGPARSIICAAYRSAIVWLVMGLASLLAIGLLEYRGIKMPVEAATDNIPFRTSVIFGLFVALALFFGIVDRARRRSLSALEATNQALSAAKVALEARNEELQTAHRAALLAATAKSRFLATISHQICTPLNGVIGATEVLVMGALSPRQQNLVSILQHSGAEALAKFAAARFDLILMDCHMPVLDGYDATRAIRLREQSDSLPRTRIIALTADVLTTHLEQCQAAGMDGYLSKPFTLEQLHAIVASPRIEFDHARLMPHPATYSTPHTALAQA